MSEGINQATLLGNIGMDPELTFAQGGQAILRLRLATNERWKDKDGGRKEATEWHTVKFFGARALGLNKHLQKGMQVLVQGRIQTQQWEDKDGNRRYTTEIIGTDLRFCGGGQGGSRAEAPAAKQERAPAGGNGPPRDDFPADDFGDDDIPFATNVAHTGRDRAMECRVPGSKACPF